MWEVVGKALAKVISPAGLDNRTYRHLSCRLSYRHSLPTNGWRMWHGSCSQSWVWCVGVCIWWQTRRALRAWASRKRSFGRHVVSISCQYWGYNWFPWRFKSLFLSQNKTKKTKLKKLLTVFPCDEPISQTAGKASDNLRRSIGREVRCYDSPHDVCEQKPWLALQGNSLVQHVDGFLTCGARLS